MASHLISALIGLVFVLIVQGFFGDAIPLEFFEFWKTSGTLTAWLLASWPIFAWAVIINLIWALFLGDSQIFSREEESFALIFSTSLRAGVMEEIIYRWIFFFTAIILVQLVNFFFFGFLGFGIFEWFHLHVLGHIANFFTLGKLEVVLFHPAGWAVGAGLLATNGSFRDLHEYQGRLGWVNSWFIGMFMFYLLFTYGLLVCIVVHVVYDILCFGTTYLVDSVRRSFRPNKTSY